MNYLKIKNVRYLSYVDEFVRYDYDILFDFCRKNNMSNFNVNYAIKTGHHEIIRYFMRRGNLYDYRTIHHVAKNGDIETLKCLVELGVQLNENTMIYIVKYELNVVKYFIENGVPCDNWSILCAISRGNLDVVRYLIGLGLYYYNDVNISIANNQLSILKYLIKIIPFCMLNIRFIALKGNYAIIRYLVQLGVTFDLYIVDHMVKIKCIKTASYLIRLGWTISEWGINHAKKMGYKI